MESSVKFENPSPEENANFLSKIFSCWLFPFLRQRYKSDVEMKDIYRTTDDNLSGYLGDLLEKNWNTEINISKKKNKDPSLLRAVIKTFGFSYLRLGFWLILETVVLRSFQPYVLCEFLKYFQSDRKDAKVEIIWTLGITIILTNFLANLVYKHYFVNCQIIGMKVRTAFCSLIYRKTLKLSHMSLSQTTPGEVINLVSNDLPRIENAAVYIHYMYATPLQVIVMIYLIYNIVGIAGVPGILFIAMEGLVQGYFSKMQGKLKSKETLLTGERLARTNDVISGIQVIKMYAWERPFQTIVEIARELELSTIAKSFYIKGITAATVVFTEKVALYLTVITYVLLGEKLSGNMVFSLAQFVNIMQATVCYYLSLAYESCVDVKLTVDRLQEFLLLNEISENGFGTTITGKNIGSVKITHVTSGWLHTVSTLFDISLNIRQGTLCCIVGEVGAGKTSLLHLLLKELHYSSGKIDISGKISYASQDPWLFVASVRNNILFGQEFIKHKYERVVTICSLYKDFQQFPYKDQTILGERGISLSGGQRARINLARAIYLDADIYLLDDPLSAVDIKVAKHLFKVCIKTYLNNKTRILVTHQLQFLREADLVIILEEGKISKVLKTDDLSESNLSRLNILSPNHEKNENDFKSKLVKRTISIRSNYSTNLSEKEQDEDEETMSNGVFIWSFINYFTSGTNKCVLILLLTLFVIAQIVLNASVLWVMYWSDIEERSLNSTSYSYTLTENKINNLTNTISIISQSSNIDQVHLDEGKINPSTTNYFYLYVYSGLTLSCIILSLVRSLFFCRVCINSSRELHRGMLGRILRVPMRFFETNPSGRIMNRFSKHIGCVDNTLPDSLLWSTQIFFVLIGIVIMIGLVSPWTLVPLLMTGLISYYTIALFLPALIKIVKLEANNRSPVFSHITATMRGLSTIRSSNAEQMVKRSFESLVDIQTSTRHMSIVCCRSFCFYLENIYIVLLAVVIFMYIILPEDNIASGNVGMVLSQINILAGCLQYVITTTTQAVTAMVRVDRIDQYMMLETEEAADLTHNIEDTKKICCHGKIDFVNVFLGYVPGEPPVLKNLNLSIRPGEKIGIVGRTGAGKSSLITCLFRLAPIDGTIFIDDVDISLLDLKTLRSNISVIPQEPVLFSASLRYNLDPLEICSDETLWKVLENVRLKDYVDSLDQNISTGGSNFSTGQRQLMCLARAIIRNNRILIMDEATANVDLNTDELIQRTIHENFSSCTVLIIAHRLNTVMDSDRVLVMDSGQAVEFDHPHELLQNPDGCFSRMVKETGMLEDDGLKMVAKDTFEEIFLYNE